MVFLFMWCSFCAHDPCGLCSAGLWPSWPWPHSSECAGCIDSSLRAKDIHWSPSLRKSGNRVSSCLQFRTLMLLNSLAPQHLQIALHSKRENFHHLSRAQTPLSDADFIAHICLTLTSNSSRFSPQPKQLSLCQCFMSERWFSIRSGFDLSPSTAVQHLNPSTTIYFLLYMH